MHRRADSDGGSASRSGEVSGGLLLRKSGTEGGRWGSEDLLLEVMNDRGGRTGTRVGGGSVAVGLEGRLLGDEASLGPGRGRRGGVGELGRSGSSRSSRRVLAVEFGLEGLDGLFCFPQVRSDVSFRFLRRSKQEKSAAARRQRK